MYISIISVKDETCDFSLRLFSRASNFEYELLIEIVLLLNFQVFKNGLYIRCVPIPRL